MSVSSGRAAKVDVANWTGCWSNERSEDTVSTRSFHSVWRKSSRGPWETGRALAPVLSLVCMRELFRACSLSRPWPQAASEAGGSTLLEKVLLAPRGVWESSSSVFRLWLLLLMTSDDISELKPMTSGSLTSADFSSKICRISFKSVDKNMRCISRK